MTKREFSNWITRFWDWIDSRGIIRRSVLGSVFFQTYWVTHWAMSYAEVSTRPGLEVAAIIAAVSAQCAALAGFIFSSYKVPQDKI